MRRTLNWSKAASESMCADFSRFAFSADASDISLLAKRSAPEAARDDSKRVAPPKNEPVKPALQNTGGGGLSELYRGTDSIERPLKVLIVGHNPSDQSWAKGHYYANPNNRMWNLLQKAGIVPSHYKAAHDKLCPDAVGLGFTDVMSGVAESQSCRITDATIKTYKSGFFRRLEAHLERAAFECAIPIEEAYPRVIAFSGVRQWKALFPAGYFDEHTTGTSSSKGVAKGQPLLTHMFGRFSNGVEAESIEQADSCDSKSNNNKTGDIDITSAGVTEHETTSVKARQQQCTIPYGVQTVRPEGWPALLRKSIVFLLPSSSGAAAMTNEEREGPYMVLGQLLREERFRWVPGTGLAAAIDTASSSGAHSSGPTAPPVGCPVSSQRPCAQTTGGAEAVAVAAKLISVEAHSPDRNRSTSSSAREVISVLSSPEECGVVDLLSD